MTDILKIEMKLSLDSLSDLGSITKQGSATYKQIERAMQGRANSLDLDLITAPKIEVACIESGPGRSDVYLTVTCMTSPVNFGSGILADG